MIGVLHLVAYIATGLAFCFVILSLVDPLFSPSCYILACGLYYLAELVEEYSVYTKKVIKVMTGVIISLHVLFWIFDRLPFFYLAFSIFCHVVYSMNLQNFPFISLTSIPFISSCILVFANHFLWFKYFTTHYRPFMDIAAFFGLCVWLVPFAYFISLSANDNALPTSDPAFDAIPNQQKQGLMKTLLNYAGIKSQDNTTSLDHYATTTTTTSTHTAPINTNLYAPNPSSYNQPTSGMASGIHYNPPNRDLQNRKLA